MKTQLTDYLKALVGFQTTQDKPEEIEACLGYIQKQMSFYPFTIKRYISNNKPSLVVTTEKTNHSRIFLAAHIDVVPAPSSLFRLTQVGDRLTGRGVSDMKFAIASYLVALKSLYTSTGSLPSIGLMLTSDEEVEGNNGPGYLLTKEGYTADVVVLPDGGDNWHIVEEAKGLLQVKLTILGKAAHSSRPWEGENAIEKVMAIGRKIQATFPNPKANIWQTTINFGRIEGGKAVNQICPEVSLWLDWRFTAKTTAEKIMTTLQRLAPNARFEVHDELPAFFVDRDNSFVKTWAELISQKPREGVIFIKEHGATDGPFFSASGIPTIVSKPIGGAIHTDHEWLSLKSLVEFTEIIKRFASSA